MFELTRWNPAVSPMRDLMNAIAGDAFLTRDLSTDEALLPLDISETEDALVVRASLPGFDRDSVDVQVHNGVLSIKAEQVQTDEEKNETFHRRERVQRTLSRSVTLPTAYSEGDAGAELKDGVLTVRLPQSEAVRPKRLTVN